MARIEEGRDLSYLLGEGESAEELAYYHSLDISGSVYARMRELGMSQAELARRMGVHRSVVTRIIRGSENLTLKTIGKLEKALDFRLDAGFRYGEPYSLGESRPYEWGPSADRCDRPAAPVASSTVSAASLTVLEGGIAA